MLSIIIEIPIAKIMAIRNPTKASISVTIICSFRIGKLTKSVLNILVGPGKIYVGTTSNLATTSHINTRKAKKENGINLSPIFVSFFIHCHTLRFIINFNN